MFNNKINKLIIFLFLILFFLNIHIFSSYALKEKSESLITISYLRKKYMVDFDNLLNNKIKNSFQEYIINKKKYYDIDNYIINDILYENLSKKINVFQQITLKKMIDMKLSNGQKILLTNGKILLINGELINLSNSKQLKFNNYLLKNTVYISYKKSFLKSYNNDTILFLSN